MDKILVKLINTFGVSGHEDEIKSIIKDELSSLNYNIKEDKIGNIIVKIGQGKEKFMICSHIDSIGFMVSFIEENGLIRAEKIGNFNSNNLSHSFIRFKNGVVGKVLVNNNKIFIDIGAKNRKEAINKVREGYTACLVGPYLEFSGNNLVSPALDSRIGCYILLRLIKEAKKTDKEIYFVFSVQEELGGKGTRIAAYNIDPDFCIILNVENAKDAIDFSNNIEINKGMILKLMDNSIIMDEHIKNILEEASNKVNANIQYKVNSSTPEEGTIHNERPSIKMGEIAIPCKYKNSISEMVSINDIEGTIKILKRIISNEN